MRAESRSLSRERLIARAPRIALVTVCGILTLAGLRAAIAPPAPVQTGAPPAPSAPPAAGAFAEAFVRDYLTWSSQENGGREQRLSAYLADDLDDDAGLVPASGSDQRVLWAVAAGARASETRGRWQVPVLAALADGRRLTVIVRVAAGAGGSLTVTDYPTLTALASTSAAGADRYGQQLTNPELERVATRAVRNYLAGRGPDLAADLAPGTRTTTPDAPSRLQSIDEISWQHQPRSIAVLATTQLPGGTRIQTRLHLNVTKQTRWFITAINPQGDTP